MRRVFDKQQKCHSQSFSCPDELIDKFDNNSRNFEVENIKIKIKSRAVESSNTYRRSEEIKKFLFAFIKKCQKK